MTAAPLPFAADDIERHTRSVELHGESFPVLDVGSGPPVLLLHGFPDSRRLWRLQIPALLQAGMRVIAPDQRGFGDAPIDLNVEGYRAKRLVADGLAIASALAVDRFALVGHDWGASIAWGVAMAAPERVERLVVLSVGAPGASGWHTIEQRERSWYFYFFQFRDVAEAWLQHDDWRLLREWSRGAPDLDASIRDLARPQRLTAALNWYRANVAPKAPPNTPSADRRAAMPRVAMPVLALWGEHDPYLTEAQMTSSSECVAGPWEYHRIASAGHWLMLDQPAEVNARLVRFLATQQTD